MGATQARHRALCLLLHEEHPGSLVVAAATQAAQETTSRAKVDARWPPGSANALNAAAYGVLASVQPKLAFHAGGRAAGGR